MDQLDKRMDYVARVSLILTGTVVATLLATIIVNLIR